MKLLLMFLCALIVSQPVLAASEAERLSRIDDCSNAIRNVSPGDFESGISDSVLSTCNDMYLADDVAVQTLAFVLGEPVYSALEMLNALTGIEHGMSEDSTALTYFSVLHTILGVINNAFFSVFLFFATVVLLTQMWRWASGGETVGVKEWFSLHGSSITLSGIMAAPAVGWMSTIQFLGTCLILGVVFLTKTAITMLFLGSFFGEVATEIVDGVKPELEKAFMQTTLMYQCDITRRQSLVQELAMATTYRNRTEFESDPLFSCLTSDVLVDEMEIGDVLDDGFRATIPVTLSPIAQTERCVDENESYMNSLGMSEITECGVVSLNLPAGEPSSYTSMVEFLKAIFLTTSVHDSSRTLAIKLNEYLCREKITGTEGAFGDVDSLCMSPRVSGAGYDYDWLANESAGTEELLKLNLPMSSSSKVEMRADVAQLQADIVTAVLAETQSITGFSEEAFQSIGQDESTVIESGVDSVVNKIRRGAWMVGGLYFSSIGEDVQESEFVNYLSTAYTAELNILSAQSLVQAFDYSMSGYEEVFSKPKLVYGDDGMMGIIPASSLYWEQISCWYQQSDCVASPLNPFSYMSEVGVELIDSSLNWYLSSKIITEVAFRLSSLEGRSRLMAGDVFSSLHMLYLLIGVMLVFGIPLIFVLKLMSSLFYWVFDVLKEILGLHIAFCFSPLGHIGDNLVQRDVRASLHRLIGLSGYFFFIIIGVVISFVSFTFLFSFNVIVVGALSYMIGFGQSTNSIDAIVFRAIFDTTVVVILFFEAKECSKILETLPKAIMDHYGLNASRDNGITEQMIGKFRDYVLPGVGSFMDSVAKRF